MCMQLHRTYNHLQGKLIMQQKTILVLMALVAVSSGLRCIRCKEGEKEQVNIPYHLCKSGRVGLSPTNFHRYEYCESLRNCGKSVKSRLRLNMDFNCCHLISYIIALKMKGIIIYIQQATIMAINIYKELLLIHCCLFSCYVSFLLSYIHYSTFFQCPYIFCGYGRAQVNGLCECCPRCSKLPGEFCSEKEP